MKESSKELSRKEKVESERRKKSKVRGERWGKVKMEREVGKG